jgi:hypothetical protein
MKEAEADVKALFFSAFVNLVAAERCGQHKMVDARKNKSLALPKTGETRGFDSARSKSSGY